MQKVSSFEKAQIGHVKFWRPQIDILFKWAITYGSNFEDLLRWLLKDDIWLRFKFRRPKNYVYVLAPFISIIPFAFRAFLSFLQICLTQIVWIIENLFSLDLYSFTNDFLANTLRNQIYYIGICWCFGVKEHDLLFENVSYFEYFCGITFQKKHIKRQSFCWVSWNLI